MTSFIAFSLVVFSLVATLSFASDSNLASRELTESATLKDCFLVNIETRSESRLKENDSFTLDKDNDMGYSIRCDISSTGRLSSIKFSYDGTVHVESASPYYMFGDKVAGRVINAVDFLSSCGRKIVKVQGFLSDKLAFEETFSIRVRNPNGAACESPTAPVPAPTKPPTKAPVRVGCPAEVTGYTLIDANTAKDIMPLRSYSMSDVSESLNIRVDIRECSRRVVESVFIDFDGETRCENNSPYSAFGDKSTRNIASSKADYNGRAIGVGRYVIKATPYTSADCRGTAGRTHKLEFEVKDDVEDEEDDYY